MKPSLLLAKRPKDPKAPEPQETLLGHTQTVIHSFQIMFGPSPTEVTRLRQLWLRFFRLDESAQEIFFINGVLSCGLHDIGKANNGFQDIVHRGKGFQATWHEHLSGLFLFLPEIQRWLNGIPEVDVRIILSAVIGHHLRASYQEFGRCLNPDIRNFRIFPEGMEEVFEILSQYFVTAEPFGLNGIPSAWSFLDGPSSFFLGRFKDQVLRTLRSFQLELRRNSALHHMLLAVRAALVLADSAGSAMVRENRDLEGWLTEAFGGEVLSGEYIEKQVISPRVKQLEAKTGKEFVWDKFQDASESLPPRSLLLAPCGSGKTLAAWRWIKARLKEHPVARVIFLYPTRATATEGFRDYIAWAPEADAALIHGTAAYDLEGLFNNPEDERTNKEFTTDERLFSLGFWHRRVFSGTVDQFLGFMQQVYRSVCLLPLLADSVLVIDEVHSFDRNLFSVLKRFLKEFDIPVLCMTASLPPNRRQDLLVECSLKLFPEDLQTFSDLEVKATYPRYQVEVLEDAAAAQEIALEAYYKGKRVLWVVNTVSRCQALVRSLAGFQVLCYHSRFKLEDRKSRHDAVIQAFQSKSGPVLALTTQVCEMSLDLDAEVLISEIAPITSMIQRLGRCNRHSVPEEGRCGEAHFYPPEDWAPYRPEDLKGQEAFLSEVRGKKVSQLELEQLLDKYGPAEVEVERLAAFLENGPWAQAREESLREKQEFTVSTVLDDDLERYFELRRKRQSIDGLLVPVPRKWARRHPRLGSFPLVASASHYHPDYGFLDYPMEEIL